MIFGSKILATFSNIIDKDSDPREINFHYCLQTLRQQPQIHASNSSFSAPTHMLFPSYHTASKKDTAFWLAWKPQALLSFVLCGRTWWPASCTTSTSKSPVTSVLGHRGCIRVPLQPPAPHVAKTVQVYILFQTVSFIY